MLWYELFRYAPIIACVGGCVAAVSNGVSGVVGYVALLTTVGIAAAVPKFLKMYANYHRVKDRINAIPGPPAMPFPFGNMGDIVAKANSEGTMGVIFWIHEMGLKYGKFFRIWMGPIPTIVVTNPEIIKEVAMKDPKYMNKGQMYDGVRPWLRGSILITESEEWRAKRTQLNHVFSAGAIESYIPVFVESARTVIDMWKQKHTQELDVYTDTTALTISVIASTIFGVDIQKYDESFIETSDSRQILHKLVFDFRNIVTEVHIRLATFHAILPEWLYLLTPSGLRYTKMVAKVRDLLCKIVLDTLETCKNSSSADGSRRNKLIERIHFGKHFDGRPLAANTDEIVDECMAFMFGGQESVPATVTWALVYLSQPENDIHLKRVRAELDRVLAGANPTWESMKSLSYLDNIISEVLRLKGPGTEWIRETKEDITINNINIPGGTSIFIDNHSLHLDPDVWPEPEKFDPTRFYPEAVKSRHAFSYIPFAAGARNCIGRAFGLAEAKVILAMYLQNFEFQISPGHKPHSILTMLQKPNDAIFNYDIIQTNKKTD